MTRYSRRKTSDKLHCTFSAIIDIFEMNNEREPTSQEVNNVIMTIGNHGSKVR